MLSRAGNRSRDAAPQGLYGCRGQEQWLALSVATDQQWHALKDALGDPLWADDPALDTMAGRERAHDTIDAHLQQWAQEQDLSKAVEALIVRGIPAAQVRDPRLNSTHPQMVARSHFEELDHPVVGPHCVPTLPFKFASVDRWYRAAAPVLGQHNRDILARLLALDDAAIDDLTASHVIGTRPLGID